MTKRLPRGTQTMNGGLGLGPRTLGLRPAIVLTTGHALSQRWLQDKPPRPRVVAWSNNPCFLTVV